MARKKKSSPLEDMMDLVSLMPWWAGVAIAAIGYVVLHRMATPVQVTAVQPGQVSHLMTQTVIAGLATAGQNIVPLVWPSPSMTASSPPIATSQRWSNRKSPSLSICCITCFLKLDLPQSTRRHPARQTGTGQPNNQHWRQSAYQCL